MKGYLAGWLAVVRGEGVAANLAAYVVLGCSGILLHVIVGWVWGAATLGAFNQVFGAYLLAGQIAALGLQNAALRFAAAEPEAVPAIAAGSLAACAVCALPVAGAFWLLAGPIGAAFDSPATTTGMAIAAPGVFLFAVNKVILALINGSSRMVLFGVLQALRAAAIVVLICAAALLGMDGSKLAFALVGAELAVLATAVARIAWTGFEMPRLDGARIRELLSFGVKSLLGTSLAELNMRVDILVLGLFSPDAVVGIYALASTVIEGLIHGLSVVRALVAPALVVAVNRDAGDRRGELLRRCRNYTYAGAAACAALALPAYALFLHVSGLSQVFSASLPLFAILLLGLLLSSGYVPLGTVLMLAGRQADQTMLAAATVAVNLALNLALAAAFGATGAAVATAGAGVASTLFLHHLIATRLGLRL